MLRFIPASAGNRTVTSIPEWLKTDHPREVIEAPLAHMVRNRVEAAYARSDLFERRRVVMDDQARYFNGNEASPYTIWVPTEPVAFRWRAGPPMPPGVASTWGAISRPYPWSSPASPSPSGPERQILERFHYRGRRAVLRPPPGSYPKIRPVSRQLPNSVRERHG